MIDKYLSMKKGPCDKFRLLTTSKSTSHPYIILLIRVNISDKFTSSRYVQMSEIVFFSHAHSNI